jgi:hypothetical protein
MASSRRGDDPGTDFAKVGERWPIYAEMTDLIPIFAGLGDGMSRIGGRLSKCSLTGGLLLKWWRIKRLASK